MMEQTERSQTSTYKIQTPGNYPEESKQHSEGGESLKSRIRLYKHVSLLFCDELTVEVGPKHFRHVLHGWQVIGRLNFKISLRPSQIRGQGHYRLSCVGHWAGQIANCGWSCVLASLIHVTQMAPHKTRTGLKGQFHFTVWKTSYPWNGRLQNYTLLQQEFILKWWRRYGWLIRK
jgi:hypothetical protein